MDSLSEVRRVRKAMSASVGHDMQKLAALINSRRSDVLGRIIDPGTSAEQCDGQNFASHPIRITRKLP